MHKVIVAFIFTLIVFCGCGKAPPQKAVVKSEWELVDSDHTFTGGYSDLHAKKIKYDGHQYIVFDAHYRLSVVHDPKCGCSSNK